MNPRKHDNKDSLGFSKGKACLGWVYFSSIRQSKGKNPLCYGISVSREVWDSSFREMPKFEYFTYDCMGYIIYLDQSGKQSSSDKETTWKPPVCYGLLPYWYAIFKQNSTADIRAHALNKEGAQEVPNESKSF